MQPLRGVLPQLLGARARGVRARGRSARERGRSGARRRHRGAHGRLARASSWTRCAAAPSCRWPSVAPKRASSHDARRPAPRCGGRRGAGARSRSPRPGATTSLMIGPPGRGQDDARAPPPGALASAVDRRGARGHGHPQRRRAAVGFPRALARAPVPRAAPHRERGRPRGRRRWAAPGRGEPRPPRRALPRRAGRVSSGGARGAAAAARGRRRHHLARPREGHVPRAPAPRLRDEPLRVRLARRRQRAVRLLARAGARVPREDERAAPRPHRRSRRACRR